MNNSNGVSSYLAGPGGRFDLANPSTQAMVRDVMGNPAIAPKYGVSLPEIFQLHQLLKQISAQTPQPQQTTVADDLKMAALASIQAPNAAPPQGAQPPQGIQQAMPQAQMPQNPMEQGVAGLDTGMMENAEYAGGGIVAFADEGLVDVPPGTPGEGAAPGTAAEMYARLIRRAEQRLSDLGTEPTLQEAMEARRVAREAAGITGKLGEERLKKLKEAATEDTGREAENARFALARAGFKMAEAAGRRGAARTGFLGAAAEGATAGLTDYVSAQKELRNLQAVRDKEIAEIQRLQRAEELGFVKDASGDIDKHRARKDAAEKGMADVQTDIARMQSQGEGRREEIASREEVARLDREAAAQRNRENIAAQAATRAPDIVQLVRSKEFQAAYGKLSGDEQFKVAAKLKQTAEKTYAADASTVRKAAESWASALSATHRALADKASKGDTAARQRLEALRAEHYGNFGLNPPSGAPYAATPGATPQGEVDKNNPLLK